MDDDKKNAKTELIVKLQDIIEYETYVNSDIEIFYKSLSDVIADIQEQTLNYSSIYRDLENNMVYIREQKKSDDTYYDQIVVRDCIVTLEEIIVYLNDN
jgi:hypothetical protein